jgi:hypothetical protein
VAEREGHSSLTTVGHPATLLYPALGSKAIPTKRERTSAEKPVYADTRTRLPIVDIGFALVS